MGYCTSQSQRVYPSCRSVLPMNLPFETSVRLFGISTLIFIDSTSSFHWSLFGHQMLAPSPSQVVKIELDPRVVLEHLEPDRVHPSDKLLLRIDADIEIVVEQIIVGAIAAILATQEVGVRWSWWELLSGSALHRLVGKRRRERKQ